MTCDNGNDFLLGDKTPKAITAKCKCPHNKNTGVSVIKNSNFNNWSIIDLFLIFLRS